MRAVREVIRHLQDGGATMLFPTGIVDPDPAFMDGADQAIGLWSSSLEIFTRRVPQTQVQITIVSGVVAPEVLSHPLTLLGKEPWKKQRIGEYVQSINMLARDKEYDLHPRITIEHAFTAEQIRREHPGEDFLPLLIQRARSVLRRHMSEYYPPSSLPLIR
jgi:hypothetical protein